MKRTVLESNTGTDALTGHEVNEVSRFEMRLIGTCVGVLPLDPQARLRADARAEPACSTWAGCRQVN